jgi:hypothetical protein
MTLLDLAGPDKFKGFRTASLPCALRIRIDNDHGIAKLAVHLRLLSRALARRNNSSGLSTLVQMAVPPAENPAHQGRNMWFTASLPVDFRSPSNDFQRVHRSREPGSSPNLRRFSGRALLVHMQCNLQWLRRVNDCAK